MRKLLTFLIAAIFSISVTVSSFAGSMMLLGAGTAAPTFAQVGQIPGWPPVQVVASASYTGPGDVVTGALAAYGLRAYNTADRGNRLINICDPSNVTCADWSSSATTGKLIAGTNPLNGTDCTTATTCTVKIWYDRSGALNCGGSACDASQATAASRPTLTFSCINGLPCLVFAGSQVLASPTTFGTISTAATTVSAVANRTGAFTSAGNIFSYGGSSSSLNFNYRQVANTMQMYAGSVGQIVGNITDSNFHAFQAVYANTSSDLMCGGGAGTNCSTTGTSNAILPGNVGGGTSFILCIGQGFSVTCTGNPLTGDVSEILLYGSIFTGTQQTNMNANQYTFWGPF